MGAYEGLGSCASVPCKRSRSLLDMSIQAASALYHIHLGNGMIFS